MEVSILKALFFGAVLLDGVYLGVLVHELGHALAALLLTRQSIEVQVGTNDQAPLWRWGRLGMRLGLAGFRYGATRYDRSRESIGTQRWVISGGPLASIMATALFALALSRFEPWSWLWLALLAFFVANLRILLVSLWPIEYAAPDGSGDRWLSDSLDFWRLGGKH